MLANITMVRAADDNYCGIGGSVEDDNGDSGWWQRRQESCWRTCSCCKKGTMEIWRQWWWQLAMMWLVVCVCVFFFLGCVERAQKIRKRAKCECILEVLSALPVSNDVIFSDIRILLQLTLQSTALCKNFVNLAFRRLWERRRSVHQPILTYGSYVWLYRKC